MRNWYGAPARLLSRRYGYEEFVRLGCDINSTLEYTTTRFARRQVGDSWQIQALVRDGGSVTMPVDVGAVSTFLRRPRARRVGYVQVLTRLTLSAGDSATVTIRSPFKPASVVVDPDVRVLMLRAVGEVKVGG